MQNFRGQPLRPGATTLNLPDTVGYAIPGEFSDLVKYVMKNTPNMDKAILSVHCHNDLGLATANTLAAIRAGGPPGRGDHQRHRGTGWQHLHGRGGDVP